MGPNMGGGGRIKFDPAFTAITAVGNSLMDAGTGSVMVAQMAAAAPINGAISITNVAHAGWTIRDLINSIHETNAAYKTGKTNIMFFWEYTNSVYNQGLTGPQVIADTLEFIALAQSYVRSISPAQRPWIIMTASSIPRQDSAPATGATQLAYIDNYLRNNWRAMGFKSFTEFRRLGGPFYIQDPTVYDAFSSGAYQGDHVHMKPDGSAFLVGYAEPDFKKLPAR